MIRYYLHFDDLPAEDVAYRLSAYYYADDDFLGRGHMT